MTRMLRNIVVRSVLVLAFGTGVLAQAPAPFPRPGQAPASKPQAPATAPPQQQSPTAAPPAPLAEGAPTEEILGAPIYPSAQYLESYDAGRGQRFYIFGAVSDFVQVSTYYKNMLKQKGELIFEEPPVQMFDLGRFR